MKIKFSALSLLVVASMLLAACSPKPTPTPSATEPPIPTPEWKAPKSALVANPVDSAPALDGVGDEAFWADAKEIVITVKDGYNNFTTEVHLKAVYTVDSVYFLMTYADTTESFLRAPWQMQADGSWKQLKDPADLGGDNNLYYEDKFSFLWPINNSINDFAEKGCYVACHANGDGGKPFGNKYTASEGELGDLWHWKSIRNLNQIDDQYVDWTVYDPEKAKEAGRHSDPKESGGYADNFGTLPDPADPTKTIPDKTTPGFYSPNTDPTTAAPGSIIDSDKLPFDGTLFKPGDYIPGIVKSEIVGDRGDIRAGWKYANGTWTVEFGRKLVTGSEFDVQFNDLAARFYFGVAVFDNAQVRHAYQEGANFLVFRP